MKELEIKKIDVFSTFKVTAYMMIIPAVLFLLIGIVTVLGGIFYGANEVFFVGIIYIVISILMVGLYGVFAMLIALIYNWLSGKFGGLKITVSEKLMESTPSINEQQLNKE